MEIENVCVCEWGKRNNFISSKDFMFQNKQIQNQDHQRKWKGLLFLGNRYWKCFHIVTKEKTGHEAAQDCNS